MSFECFAKPWLIITFLVFFAIFSIFVKIDTLPRRIFTKQNTAARVVLQVSKFQLITPVLCELHWLPIQYRISFKILLLVYKSLNGTSPSYLAQKLHYRSHTRSLRSVSNELLMQPRSYTKTYGDRAFAVHIPREWNLINTLRNSEVQHHLEF